MAASDSLSKPAAADQVPTPDGDLQYHRSDVTTEDIEALLFPKPDAPPDPRGQQRIGNLAAAWLPTAKNSSFGTALSSILSAPAKDPTVELTAPIEVQVRR